MSTVAGAVVTIDGDSSGLVGALQKGEKAIGGVKTEARKLTDQLREVADDADKAAGALVEKIGGPSAIKAIGGVALGMEVAKAGVEAFLGSAESLFKSFGDEGQKVWDQTEKSLFAIKGAFAEAVLGGGSVEEMGARLKAIFDGVKIALDFLLTPIRLVSQALWGVSKDAHEAAKGVADYNAAVARAKTSNDTIRKSVEEVDAMVRQLTGTTDDNTRSVYENARTKVQASIDEIKASADVQNAVIASTVLQANMAKITQSAHEATEMLVFRGFLQREDAAAHEAKLISDNSTILIEQVRARNLAMVGERGEAIKRLQEDLDRLNKAEAEALKPPKEDKPTGGGVGAGVNEAEEAARAAAAGLAGIVKSSATDVAKGINDIHEAVDKFYQMTGMANPHEAHLFSDIVDGIAAAKTAVDEGLAAINAGREADKAKAKAAADQEVEDEKARKALLFNLAVTQNAKMLASAIAANKSMAEVARAAIGNVVSGLGDKAMVEAGAYAAEGNFTQATAMAVAGTTAYTIAAALGAQKKPNAGPPTERQQPVQNYAYNLRIDAAFADSESISRRFAQMQEGARQRGLIAGAA
jgi:hypothetical protein